MSILYPSLLWLLLPIIILFLYRPKELQDTVHLIILTLLLLALSRPVTEQSPQEEEIEGRNIIIALDVSYSMHAKDIKPDRYSYAKKTIDAFLQSNIADNITLIAFTTNPLLLSPPTTDHQLISTALKTLNIDNILTKGTSIQHLLKMVASLSQTEKNLILITDGGEESQVEPLNQIIQDGSISLHILALGTTQGVTLTKRDGTTLRDKQGNLVVSRINPLLKILSHNNTGSYREASATSAATAQELSNSIDKSRQEKISKKHNSYIELYGLPLFVALILFLMLHTRAVKYITLLSTLWSTQASASLWDEYRLSVAYQHYSAQEYNATKEGIKDLDSKSLESQILLASSCYKMGNYHKALALYRTIRSTSPQIKQILYYNIANSYAKLEQYSKASRYYAKALQLGEDNDARYNLKLVALLKDRDLSKLSMEKPQSQSNNNTPNPSEESDQDSNHKSKSVDSSGGSQGSQQSKAKSKKEQAKKIILQPSSSQKQPLSSKVYELINKGYIYEKQPW